MIPFSSLVSIIYCQLVAYSLALDLTKALECLIPLGLNFLVNHSIRIIGFAQLLCNTYDLLYLGLQVPRNIVHPQLGVDNVLNSR